MPFKGCPLLLVGYVTSQEGSNARFHPIYGMSINGLESLWKYISTISATLCNSWLPIDFNIACVQQWPKQDEIVHSYLMLVLMHIFKPNIHYRYYIHFKHTNNSTSSENSRLTAWWSKQQPACCVLCQRPRTTHITFHGNLRITPQELYPIRPDEGTLVVRYP